MPSDKLVSVCINAYNAELTIAETVKSVLDQSYRNLQVIVVDDCSQDKTVQIVRELAAEDGRIELYCLEKNGNISNCNNEAISHARGEYIAHLDSDDVWLPEKIETQLEFMESNPDCGACFTHVTAVDENTQPLGADSYFETVFNIADMPHARFIRFYYDNANRLCHSTMMIRKSVQDEIGLHDISLLYLHDYDMWARVLVKYPIHIIEKPLIKYRVRSDSNSRPTEEKNMAHNAEFARVAYNFIDRCPDVLFLEAFADKLRYGGEHSHTDTELEKAFVLLDGFLTLRGNSVMGIRKFDSLFSDKEVVNVAEKHFGFSLRDFYDLHKQELYFNPETKEQLERTDSLLRDAVAHCEQADDLNDRNQLRLEQLTGAAASLEGALRASQERYNSLMASPSMKITKPFRQLRAFVNVRRFLRTRKLPTTVKCTSKIVLYGFYGHNFGDDMFFDMLFRRYPNTLFCIEHTPDYEGFAVRYPNVKFYDITAPYYAKLDAIGRRLRIDNWSQKLLYGTSDAALHIGGSIYQQIADWQIDIEQRRQRNSQFKNFFTVSNNFGPYQTEDYRAFWANEFSHYTDVCFRDIYSYNLFSGLNNVRYAPDLLFAYGDDSQTVTERRVSVSVINPRFRVRSFTEEQSLGYESKIKELIRFYVDRGYEVSLLGFCTLEEDDREIEKLWLELEHKYREHVRRICYTDNLSVITEEIKRSEKIVATRFHAMILGYVLGKQVLPVCYGDKVSNVIDDLALTDTAVKFEEIASYTAEELDGMTNSVGKQRISQLRNDAISQFYALDKFVIAHNGAVVG